ncbi:hypothetical protein SeMB42_g04609 [Synchytrium endobioticum]|uniref:Cell division control protein 73 C-terminal domain-containing protein n=1 Tax=Synchytrium endobioticum TaxID=286115 RepID=A0A507CWZ6_9FUNG|nr:hypothetical protein SeMB42_g04609 [Synchytrium endobioticum]
MDATTTSALPAQLLRTTLVNAPNNEVLLLAADQQSRANDFIVAVYAKFIAVDSNHSTLVPLSQPSGYKEYSLLDLLNFAYSSLYKDDTHHSDYLRETVALNQKISEYDRLHNTTHAPDTKPRSIEAISYIDRKDLKEFLTGTHETSATLLDASKKRAATQGLETDHLPKKSRFDYSYEKVTNDRKTIMSIRLANRDTTQKLFHKIRVLAEKTFQPQPPPSQDSKKPSATTAPNGAAASSVPAPSARTPSSARGSHRTESKSRQSSSTPSSSRPTKDIKPPIILVPAATVSMLSLYNAASFLQDANYKTVDEARAIQTQGKPQTVIVTRKNAPDGMPQRYQILDYADKFKDDEWNRVVAVFTDGKAWQFTNWKRGGKDFKEPVDIFQKYRGYALVYHNDNLTPPLANWNVKFLRVHRTSRHTDAHLLNEFWQDLERWIVVNRPGRFA